MVEAAADVASRGESDDNVRSELAVRAVVFVRAFDQLFHRRPKIVCELCSFDDNPDVITVAREPVRSTDDEILCNRGAEDASIPEFLQHPLRQIENPAFIPGCNILAP